ncbi:MAG: ribonuclease III [Candidatus Mycalebacterium zealandia]|nr:MAG: ribonuclease III [Candidatus Mycalebacterium zealandia]
MCFMKNIKLGYDFRDSQLLEAAFTHRSYRNEKGGNVDNQRLEFLGDSVVGCVAAEDLWKIFPEADEGELSVKRSSIVSGENLAGYARALGLGECMLLGKGEEKSGRERESNLADVFEAVVGAIFLDGGYETARKFVSDLILSNREKWSLVTDYKSELQKAFHKRNGSLPVYETEEAGSAYEKYFFSAVGDGSDIFGRGQGRSKKEAEQRAAKEALESL